MSDFDRMPATSGSYAGEQAMESVNKMVRMPTLRDRLAEAVKSAESKLAEAKRAREIFDAHPELEELLNIMQRGHF